MPRSAIPTSVDMVKRSDGRRLHLAGVAGHLFASRGYEATSMRDIAGAAGLMPASLYSHFASKEDLLIAVSESSVAKIESAVRDAIVDIRDPWLRLEVALVAHAEALLDSAGFRVLVLLMLPPSISPGARNSLVAQRDRYDHMFDGIVDALDLSSGIDRRMYRTLVLSMMNTIPVWYRPDGAGSPRDVVDQVMRLLRCQQPEPISAAG